MDEKDQVVQAVLRMVPLGEEEVEFVRARLISRPLKKGAHYFTMGFKNDGVGYLLKGLLRSYYYDEAGAEITAGFIEPGAFFADKYSFQTDQPSERTIEALTDCQVWGLSEESLVEIRHRIQQWRLMEQHYLTELLKRKVNFQRKVVNSTTAEAYQHFRETYPVAAGFAPRYQIASFLGMSPFTLSRIKV